MKNNNIRDTIVIDQGEKNNSQLYQNTINSVITEKFDYKKPNSAKSDKTISILGLNNYISHSPIIITSNNDFSSQGFLGDGSELNPYIISSLNVSDVVGTSNLIDIRNVNVFFKIESNLLSGGLKGIYLYNTTNGVITNNTIRNTANEGITLSTWSDNNSIYSNNLLNNSNGIYTFVSDNNTIDYNIINNARSYGVYSYSNQRNKIINNIITNSSAAAIYLNIADNSTVIANSIKSISVGIKIENSNNNEITDNYIEGGVIGIKLYSGNNINILSNEVNGSYSYGIQVDYSIYSIVQYNIIYRNIRDTSVSIGLHLNELDSSYVLENNITNYFRSIFITRTNGVGNTFIKNNRLVNNSYGIYAYPVLNYVINSNVLMNSSISGMIFISANNNNITDNVIDNTDVGIDIYQSNSHHQIVSGNIIRESSSAAIKISFLSYSNTITNNTLIDNYIGISIKGSTNNITDNIILNSVIYGINLLFNSLSNIIKNNYISSTFGSGLYITDYSDYNIFSENIVMNHPLYGVFIDKNSDKNKFKKNIFRNNGYGIYINDNNPRPENNEVSFNNFYNQIVEHIVIKVFYGNITHNYYDNFNTPDSNYDGFVDTSYQLPGGSLTDDYPLINPVSITSESNKPIIKNSPIDITYIFSSIGNILTWNVNDENPGIFEVYLNNTLFMSNSFWSNNSLTINIDGFDLGTYIFNITFYDLYGNFISDIVKVIVHEGEPPSIIKSSDLSYIINSFGNYISWNISDMNIMNYTIYQSSSIVNITLESLNTTVLYYVDGLSIGEYDFKIKVVDIYGNIAESIIHVSVVNHEVDKPSIFSSEEYKYYEIDKSNLQIIKWTVSDFNPGNYNLELNGEIIMNNIFWTNGTIQYDARGHSVGVYNYTIIIYDIYGNYNINTILVTVTENTKPELSSPSDISFRTIDKSIPIIWNVTDPHPNYFNITINGKIKYSNNSWSNGSISFNTDDLPEGVYSIVITIVDIYDNISQDEVILTIIDDNTIPDLTTSGNISFINGTENNKIELNLGDKNPYTYTIKINNKIFIENEFWTNGSIFINIDFLNVGSHTIEIIVYDVYNNMASVIIFVTVKPLITETTENTTTQDISTTVSLSTSTTENTSNTTENTSNTTDSPSIRYIIMIFTFTIIILFISKTRINS